MEIFQEEKYHRLLISQARLDQSALNEFQKLVSPLIESHAHLIVNAEKVVEIEKPVSEALIRIAEEQAEKSCTFVIVNNEPNVVAAFDDELAIVPTESEAVDYFNFDELERQYNL